MDQTEYDQLTQEILELHKTVDDYGRKSVPLVLKCGEKLERMKESMAHGKWGDFCFGVQDQISSSTISRYRKLYKMSLVINLDGLTLDEAYHKTKIKNKPKKKEPETQQPEVTNEEEKKSSVDQCRLLVQSLMKVLSNSKYSEWEGLSESLSSVIKWNDRFIKGEEIKRKRWEKLKEEWEGEWFICKKCNRNIFLSPSRSVVKDYPERICDKCCHQIPVIDLTKVLTF